MSRDARIPLPYDITPPTRANVALPVMSGRPPNPSYGSRRRAALSPTPAPALISHPDDNPGPWTRRSASWSRAEDERLAQLVQLEEANAPTTTPTKMWSRVAAQLQGRTGKQCRERWLNQLKPGIRRGLWTDEEELILHQAHAELGNKWVAIAARLPGRTDNCVKNHWNSMLRKRQRREAAMRSAAAAARNSQSSRVNNTSLMRMAPPTRPEVNSELARRASAMADTRSVAHLPLPVNLYALQASSMCEGMPRALLDGTPTLTSPITPQRNAKLQIANLVAPHKGDDTVGRSFGSENTNAMGGRTSVGVYDDKSCSVLHPPLQLAAPPGNYVYGENGSFGHAAEQLAHLACGVAPAHSRKDDTAAVGTGYLASTSPVTTPVGAIVAPYSSLDQRMWNSAVADARHSALKGNSGEASDLTHSADGGRLEECGRRGRNGSQLEKKAPRLRSIKSISKTPARTNSSSLAALAAAASSVPPSPLTPESRFSCSRSVSPSPSGLRSRATSPSHGGGGRGEVVSLAFDGSRASEERCAVKREARQVPRGVDAAMGSKAEE